MKYRWIWILLTVIVMVTIFTFSAEDRKTSSKTSDAVAKVLKVKKTQKSKRVSNQPIVFGLSLRKLAHIFLYFCLGFCLTQALTGWKWKIPGAIGGSYVYGVLDEIHQHMSNRSGRWEDTLIDLIGIVIGVALAALAACLWEKNRERRKTGRQAAA